MTTHDQITDLRTALEHLETSRELVGALMAERDELRERVVHLKVVGTSP